MSGRFASDERPVCVGDPAGWSAAAAHGRSIGSTCVAEGSVSLLQLRPGPEAGDPVLVWLTACPGHQRAVRRWMRASWAADPVDTYGTRFLVEQQSVVEDVAPLWRVAVSA